MIFRTLPPLVVSLGFGHGEMESFPLYCRIVEHLDTLVAFSIFRNRTEPNLSWHLLDLHLGMYESLMLSAFWKIPFNPCRK